jgi:hypothetical protein
VKLACLVTNKYAIEELLGRGVMLLPQRVICHGCNFVLYEGGELKPPDEVIQQHEGKCPKCARKLSLLPLEVEVKPKAKI